MFKIEFEKKTADKWNWSEVYLVDCRIADDVLATTNGYLYNIGVKDRVKVCHLSNSHEKVLLYISLRCTNGLHDLIDGNIRRTIEAHETTLKTKEEEDYNEVFEKALKEVNGKSSGE